MKNWFSQDIHPTDYLLYHIESVDDAIMISKEVRKSYKKIVDAGLKDELEYLMEISNRAGFHEVDSYGL